MAKTFRQKRARFLEALEEAQDRLSQARDLLDDLPSFVTNDEQARQLVEAHQVMRESLRAQQRNLEKL